MMRRLLLWALVAVCVNMPAVRGYKLAEVDPDLVKYHDHPLLKALDREVCRVSGLQPTQKPEAWHKGVRMRHVFVLDKTSFIKKMERYDLDIDVYAIAQRTKDWLEGYPFYVIVPESFPRRPDGRYPSFEDVKAFFVGGAKGEFLATASQEEKLTFLFLKTEDAAWNALVDDVFEKLPDEPFKAFCVADHAATSEEVQQEARELVETRRKEIRFYQGTGMVRARREKNEKEKEARKALKRAFAERAAARGMTVEALRAEEYEASRKRWREEYEMLAGERRVEPLPAANVAPAVEGSVVARRAEVGASSFGFEDAKKCAEAILRLFRSKEIASSIQVWSELQDGAIESYISHPAIRNPLYSSTRVVFLPINDQTQQELFNRIMDEIVSGLAPDAKLWVWFYGAGLRDVGLSHVKALSRNWATAHRGDLPRVQFRVINRLPREPRELLLQLRFLHVSSSLVAAGGAGSPVDVVDELYPAPKDDVAVDSDEDEDVRDAMFSRQQKKRCGKQGMFVPEASLPSPGDDPEDALEGRTAAGRRRIDADDASRYDQFMREMSDEFDPRRISVASFESPVTRSAAFKKVIFVPAHTYFMAGAGPASGLMRLTVGMSAHGIALVPSASLNKDVLMCIVNDMPGSELATDVLASIDFCKKAFAEYGIDVRYVPGDISSSREEIINLIRDWVRASHV